MIGLCPTKSDMLAAAIILAGIAFWSLWIFNRLVRARNQQREAWSGVDVQLKKRADLVPILVECVSAYGKHETATLVSAARARDQSALVGEMRKLIAVAEEYPDLKAAENFRDFSAKLVAIENDLQYARRYYNGSVRDFRNLAESFPSNLVARTFAFAPGEFFEVESVTERSGPQVSI